MHRLTAALILTACIFIAPFAILIAAALVRASRHFSDEPLDP